MEYYIEFILYVISLIGMLLGIRCYDVNGSSWNKLFMNVLFLWSIILFVKLITT